MCRAHGAQYRRCPHGAPTARAAGRRAKALYGANDATTRAKLDLLPAAMQAGTTIFERVTCLRTTTDPTVVEVGALDTFPRVRAEAARNPAGLPLPLQMELAKDCVQVRVALAGQPHTDPSVLADLTTDTDDRVRYNAFTNGAVPVPVIESVLTDADRTDGDRAQALWVLNTRPDAAVDLAAYAADPVDRVRGYVAQQTTDPIVRDALLTDPAKDVRVRALRNTAAGALSPERLAALVADRASGVRSMVAQATTDPAVLDKLSTDRNELVRRSVVENANVSRETLTAMAPTDGRAAQQLVHLGGEIPLGSRTSGERRVAARSATLTPRDIATLAGDADAAVRRTLAENDATPESVRRELGTSDVDYSVRAAAFAHHVDLREAAIAGDDPVGHEAAAHAGALTPVEARKLMTSPSQYANVCAVDALDDSADLAQAWAATNDRVVRLRIARKRNAPAAAVAGAYADLGQGEQQSMLMMHKNDPAVLGAAASSRFKQMRHSAAENVNTPVHALEKLARGRDEMASHYAHRSLEALE